MTWQFISNKVSGKCILHVVGNSGTIVVAGNSTVSNLTANADEVIVGASIRQLSWGTDSGAIYIKRGSNLVMTLTESHSMELSFMPITVDSAATLSVNAASNNTITILELSKQFSAYSNVGKY